MNVAQSYSRLDIFTYIIVVSFMSRCNRAAWVFKKFLQISAHLKRNMNFFSFILLKNYDFFNVIFVIYTINKITLLTTKRCIFYPHYCRCIYSSVIGSWTIFATYYFPSHWVIITLKKRHNSALATATDAHQGHRLACLYGEVHTCQDGDIGAERVAEGHIFQNNVSHNFSLESHTS